VIVEGSVIFIVSCILTSRLNLNKTSDKASRLISRASDGRGC
jgi:hypothetical protein